MKKIISLALCLIIIFSSYKIIIKLYSYKVDDKTYEEIKNIKVLANKEEYDNFSLKLKNENPNYVFWIKVKGTNIDYPVVRGKDNEFYLNHDFYNKKNMSGTIFLDYRNIDSEDSNLVIYGHNMKNGAMFHDLTKFKDENYIKENNIITIEALEGKRTYKIFAMYVESGYNDFIKLKFSFKEEKGKYLEDINKKSIYHSDEIVTVDDDLITLSTCSYEFDEARTVIHGKRIH